ncbi:MAG: hypothetical protein QOI71_1184 [Gaiellales bacterium]|nr:hypothetical protein [Gaiellales bacterium]
MPLVALVGVVVALNPLFVQGLLPHAVDLSTYFAPSWAFLAHSLRAGSLPGWNPLAFGGQPFMGDPQAQALYPPTLLLFGLLSLPTATLCWFGFHYLLAAAGTYCLARNLRLSGPASAIASIAFAASTCLVARVQAPELLVGAAWVPVVLAAAISGASRPEARARLLNPTLAAAFALQILSGGQQVVLLTAVACVVAGTLVGRRPAVATAGSLALGAMLAAPQLLPMASLVMHSTASAGVVANGVGALSWSDRSILAGVFAHNGGEAAPVYLGIFGLGQALVGVGSGWRHRSAHVIAGLGALSLAWSFGLVGRLVTPLVPSLATVTAHQPTRALPLGVLALALGVGSFWDHCVTVRRSLLVIALSVGGLFVAGTLGPTSHTAWLVSLGLGTATLAIAWRWPQTAWPVILAALVLSVDLAVHNANLRNTHQPRAVWQATATLYPPPPASAVALRRLGVGIDGTRFAWMATSRGRGRQIVRAMSPQGQALLFPGGSMRYRLPTVGGYNPIIDRGFTAVMKRSNGRGIADRHNLYVTRAATAILRSYSVSAYLCTRTSCPPGLPVSWRGGRTRIATDPHALPFARIALGGDAHRLKGLAASWPSPDEIHVRSTTTRSAGRVTVAERYAPGWRVWVDGAGRKLSRSPLGLMSVEVTRGWKRVRFAYEPPGLRYGIAIALLAASICCVQLVRSSRSAPRDLAR